MKLERILSIGRKIVSLGLLASVLAFSPSCYNQAPKKPETKPYIEQKIPAQQEPAKPELVIKERAKTFPITSRETNLEQVVNKEDMERYFPIEMGNTWKYKRTVMPGKDILFLFKYFIESSPFDYLSEGKAKQTVGRKEKSISGIETYTVLSKAEDPEEGFVISVDDKNTRMYYSEFDEVNKITWALKKYSGGELVVWERVKGELHSDDIIAGNYFALLTLNIALGPPSNEWTIGCNRYDKEIIVPAGRFRNCLENTIRFKEKSNSTAKGWEFLSTFETHRFFAKDVGLIKEVQYDSKGEPTYTLELIEYKPK